MNVPSSTTTHLPMSHSFSRQHHTAVHHDVNVHQCTTCKKTFISKSGLYSHQQIHDLNKTSECEHCGKKFQRRNSYNEHLKSHTGEQHKCPHCSKAFVQKSNLIRHIRTHTGEKPYKCSFCERAFGDKSACNAHMKIHTHTGACSCSYCGKVFSNKQKLKYHVRKHTGCDLVTCKVCGNNFANNNSLKEHEMIHKTQSQLFCPYCARSFSLMKYLKRHITTVHHPSYSYKCHLCSKEFCQQNRLKAHQLTHSDIKYLQCRLCSKAYSSLRSLHHHLLNIHGVSKEHPNHKKSFYRILSEEIGLPQLMEEPSSSPPVLRTFYDSEEPCCREDNDSYGPPTLEPQEPCNLTSVRLPHVQTKAAKKMMSFHLPTLGRCSAKEIDSSLCGNRFSFLKHADGSCIQRSSRKTKTKETSSN